VQAQDPVDLDALNEQVGQLYQAGKYAEATGIAKRLLSLAERKFGPDHPDLATDLNNLATLAVVQRDWVRAAGYWQRATQVIERRAERGLAGSEGGSVKGESVRLTWFFSGLIKMTDRLAPQGHADRARQGRETFEKAQWAQASEAASSLSQMAARSAKGDTALASLVRERQDLVAEWQVKDKQLIAARSQLPTKRTPNAEKSLSDRLASIDARLSAIDAGFAKDFPDYAQAPSHRAVRSSDAASLPGARHRLGDPLGLRGACPTAAPW
jgi:hypothetical protein